jgi:GTP-binding protein
VGKPQVLTSEIDGKVHEPVDRVTVDVPEEYLGVVTQLLVVPRVSSSVYLEAMQMGR